MAATAEEAPSEADLAFDALYRSSRDDVYAYVAGLLRDRAAAEEVTATAFERAYRKRSRFDPEPRRAPRLAVRDRPQRRARRAAPPRPPSRARRGPERLGQRPAAENAEQSERRLRPRRRPRPARSRASAS